MASSNDQLLCLQTSTVFRRRCEGFVASWAHSVLVGGTANQKSLALSILSNGTPCFVSANIGRFVFSDNVMSGAETVTYDFVAQCAVSSISDANLQAQVNTICVAIAG